MPPVVPRIERQTLADKAAEVLRHMIMRGEIPPGTRLVEDSLAVQLGVSRAPLREALDVLSHEGLVSGQPGKGCFVEELTVKRIRDICEVRTLLEVHAAQLAATHLQPEQASQLEAALHNFEAAVAAHSVAGYVEADAELHRLIWEFSQNQPLVGMLKTLMAPLRTIIQINAESFEDWPAIWDLHADLVHGVCSRDPVLAAEAVRRNMDSATRKAVAAAERQLQSQEAA